MTLLYLSSSSIPSKYANSVHVMKMCSGFSRIVDSVILLAKRNKADLVNNEFLLYDIEREFQINYGPWLNLRGGNLLFSFWSVWKVFQLNPTMIQQQNIFITNFRIPESQINVGCSARPICFNSKY